MEPNPNTADHDDSYGWTNYTNNKQYRAGGSKISLIRQSHYYSLRLITHPLLFIINNPPTFVYMYS